MRLRYVLLSLIGLVAVGAETTCIGPAFPFIMKEFNISLGTLGLLASAWNLGYLFVVVGGLLSDRYGEPLVLSLSLALSGVSAVFISTVSSYEVLLIFFFFGGLGGAFGDAAIIPLVARLYPARSGFALNILYASFCGGAFLGPILAGFLIVRYESWRPPYMLIAFIFLPLMVVWIIQAFKLRKVGKPPAMPKTIIMNQRNFVLLGMMMASLFFYHCAELGGNAWLPSFLIFERDFPTILASLPLSLFWIFMAFGRIVLGYISDRWGFKRMILSCSVLGGFSILAATEASNRMVILALWSLSGFVFGPMFPTLMAWINRLFPAKRGFASGSAYSIGTLGAVFSPWFIGAMAESYTLGTAILFLVFSTFAIGLSTLWLDEDTIKA